jgi:hypothetical protein
MGIGRPAAIVFAVVSAGVIAFQLALAAGAPWGDYAMGGADPGMIFNAGMAAVVELHATAPAQAVAAWQAVEPVAQGLGGSGGELLGGLWVLLVSAAALRTALLPKGLGWLGVVVGAAGVLSVVPALSDLAYGFGVLQIAWFAWLSVVLLRTPARRTAAAPAGPEALQRGDSRLPSASF